MRKSGKTLRRGMIAASAVALLMTGTVSAAGVASAGTVVPAAGSGSEEYGWVGFSDDCNADMTFKWDGNGNDYARANFYLEGNTCMAWLERSINYGASWYVVSGIHDQLLPPYHGSTGYYKDGDGYLARACVGSYPGDFVCGASL
jgi:hypothetical protein